MSKRNFSLTRCAVAKLLGVHISTVRRMEERHELRWVLDKNGVHRFDPNEVAILAAKRGQRAPLAAPVSGPLAARVYKALREGMTIDQIVIETELAPDQVFALCSHVNKTPARVLKQSDESKPRTSDARAENDDAYAAMLRDLERDEARRRRR